MSVVIPNNHLRKFADIELVGVGAVTFANNVANFDNERGYIYVQGDGNYADVSVQLMESFGGPVLRTVNLPDAGGGIQEIAARRDGFTYFRVVNNTLGSRVARIYQYKGIVD